MVLNLKKEKVRAYRRMRSQDTPCGGGSRTTTTAAGTNPISSSSSITKKISRKSRRKTRSKTRKPKYLSLRLQFSTDQKVQGKSISEMPSSTITTPTTDAHPQLNLFPLHPENLVEEKDAHGENMAYFFSAADGGATTLMGLLGAVSTSSSDKDHKNHSTSTTLSPSASLTYAYGRQDSEDAALVRTAMRNTEREPSEEMWVRYSEVVERRDDQEVTSYCAAAADLQSWRNQRLSLKLDYEEILNAWSDKGSLYIHAAADCLCPQTVPDVHDNFLASQLSNGISDGWGNSGGCVWTVPEMMTSKANDEQGMILIKVKAEEQQEQVEVVAGENLKVVQREARVQRYKEKRQNRLFSKRIRYQVRKLNAEKRPRLKGRFVKRS